jgi:hypothetical protein
VFARSLECMMFDVLLIAEVVKVFPGHPEFGRCVAKRDE